MWSRKRLKKNAKKAFGRNYWGIVITSVIAAVIIGSFMGVVL